MADRGSYPILNFEFIYATLDDSSKNPISNFLILNLFPTSKCTSKKALFGFRKLVQMELGLHVCPSKTCFLLQDTS
jgi:hypothetical protein